MVLSKQAVTKCRKNQFFIVPQISQKKYSIPSHLPRLKMNNHNVERANTMKFLGVLLDDNLSRKEHIKYLKNKMAKNIGFMYRAKLFFDKESSLALYYYYINSYLNYNNLARGSTYLTNLKTYSQQKSRYSNSP